MEQKFLKAIQADEDAYYMSCPEVVGEHIANQLSRFNSAVELCCAVGMAVIPLARRMEKVIGVDISPDRIKDAKYNAELYGVADKIEFIVGDVLDENLLKNISAEVAILDPDWSVAGEKKSLHVDNIEDTQPSMKAMFDLTKRYITSNIVIRVPKNFTFETLSYFGCCRLENIIWGGKTRFKLAYFLDGINENSESDFYFDKPLSTEL
ncbi:methyltransferase domain-containing protein [Candidatus Falkowbacteria bacterium]|nr:methyltransferase domain-containing protein [Candidatus Falkowbacteria bacterium]